MLIPRKRQRNNIINVDIAREGHHYEYYTPWPLFGAHAQESHLIVKLSGFWLLTSEVSNDGEVGTELARHSSDGRGLIGGRIAAVTATGVMETGFVGNGRFLGVDIAAAAINILILAIHNWRAGIT